MSAIIKKIAFLCRVCESELQSPGMARTAEERIFFMGLCPNCEDEVPIELDKIIAALYENPLSKGSSRIN